MTPTHLTPPHPAPPSHSIFVTPHFNFVELNCLLIGVDNGEIFAPVDDGGVAVEDGQAAAGQQIITTDSGQQIIMQADGSMVTADGQQVGVGGGGEGGRGTVY